MRVDQACLLCLTVDAVRGVFEKATSSREQTVVSTIFKISKTPRTASTVRHKKQAWSHGPPWGVKRGEATRGPGAKGVPREAPGRGQGDGARTKPHGNTMPRGPKARGARAKTHADTMPRGPKAREAAGGRGPRAYTDGPHTHTHTHTHACARERGTRRAPP